MEIKTIMLDNLTMILAIMGIFATFWLANTLVSLWYNIKNLKQRFDKTVFINGVLKAVCIAFGTFMFTIGMTALVAFMDKTGIAFEGLTDEISIKSIILIYGASCLYYGWQFILTLKNIVLHKDEKALEEGKINGLDI